jgi:predicted house-cleaning noncanonical NTP pyrophosphatase (MazG superfamily)
MRTDLNLILQHRKISIDEFNTSYKGVYGVKGAGLLCLPAFWSPRFFLLSKEMYERYRVLPEDVRIALHGDSGFEEGRYIEPLFNERVVNGKAKSCRSLLFDHILGPEEQFQMESALLEIGAGEDDFVIVRSSAIDETVEYRGRYTSACCRANRRELALAIQKVYASCLQKSETSMGIVVQRYINTRRARGYLSNERRVCQKISTWLCESETVSGIGSAHVFSFGSTKGKLSTGDTFLTCCDRESLFRMLKQIAVWAHSQKLRVHYEWVWDGSVLWIVQADHVPDIRCEYPLVNNIGVAEKVGRCSLCTLVAERHLPKGTWNKLDCIKTFRECGLPVADVWVLPDKAILLALQKRKWPASLGRDVKALLNRPIVIRMDIANEKDTGKFMLARTDTVSDIESVREFLFRETGQLTKEAIEQMKVCFIFHRFIPARSSAFALSAPGRKRVRIDALWGLPDGLSYYPHDSYELSCTGLGAISKRVRYKEEYLDSDEKGTWIPKHAGKPLDWRSSLTESELRIIAKGTFAVACAVSAPVEVMWFVGIPESFGLPGCLPWYYSTEEPPTSLYGQRKGVTQRGFLVRREEDIKRLESGRISVDTISTIRLRPVPDLLRSREFIERVSEFAKTRSVSVELEGSILSHAYYLLKNKGVNVICYDPFLPEYERKQFDKLVRDLIPVKIREAGEKVKVIRVAGTRLISLLKAKAVEESLELFWTETSDQSKEEIVDLLEVLKSLAKHEGFAENELQVFSDEKRAEKGSFANGMILKETQEIPLITHGSDTPGLFEQVESWEEKAKRRRTASRSAAMVGSILRREGPNLIIPLVPPDPIYRHFGHSIDLKSLGIRINIRFREKEILVEVSELRKEGAHRDPRQLILPYPGGL